MTTWKAGEDYGRHSREIVSEEGRVVCIVWMRWLHDTDIGLEPWEPEAEGWANFRLILQAPKMLEALEAIAALKYPPWGDTNDILKIFHQCNAIARAAIAAAKGKNDETDLVVAPSK